MLHTKHKCTQSGFTVVEMAVVMAVIALLAALLIFSLGAWRSGLARDQVVNDLLAARAAMVNERNFNNAYPLSLPSTFTASDKVTVTYVSGSSTSFCINGVSDEVSTVRYYLSVTGSAQREPVAGTC